MVRKRPHLGKQVGTTSYDWSDDDEPLLSLPPVHKERYDRNPRADDVCPTVLSDEPIAPMESPVVSWLKNLSKSLALNSISLCWRQSSHLDELVMFLFGGKAALQTEICNGTLEDGKIQRHIFVTRTKITFLVIFRPFLTVRGN